MQTITLSPTIKCNLNCHYCSIDTKSSFIKEMDYLYWIKWLEDANLKEDTCFSINGGEPLLYRGIIPLVEYISARWKMELITNGMYLCYTSSWKWSNINLRVSLEPGEKLHDFNRGKGTYRKVLKNLEALPSHIKITIMSIITSKTKVSDVYNLAKDVREVHPNFDMWIRNLHLCPNKKVNFSNKAWKVYPDEDALHDNDFEPFLREARSKVPEVATHWKDYGGCTGFDDNDFGIIGDQYTFCMCYVGGETWPIEPYGRIMRHMKEFKKYTMCWDVCPDWRNGDCCGCYNALMEYGDCIICELNKGDKDE